MRIDVQMSLAAYGDAGRGIGTGFIVDKKLGLIVTNQHVCGANGVANYFITFDTGQQIEAKLLYYDLWARLRSSKSCTSAYATRSKRN